MAGRDAALFEQILDRLFETQQAHGVGDRGSIFAGALGDIFLRETEFVAQALKGAGLLDRVQVLALKVLNESHLQRDFSGTSRTITGTRWSAGPLRGAPATLAGNQLIAQTDRSDDDAAGRCRSS